MKIYILDQRKDTTRHNAVGKAMVDVFDIMKKCNVKTMPGVPKDASKIFKVLDLVILAAYGICILGRKDYCIYVYQDNSTKIKLLKKLSRIRKFTTICFINDINSIRSDGLYSEKRKQDIDNDFTLIGLADVILAPNEGSITYMDSRSMTSKMIPVKVWDYLMDKEMGDRCDANVRDGLAKVCSIIDKNQGGNFINEQRWKIGFAGNLGKSDFLGCIDEVYDASVEYHLWGDREDKEFINNNVIYEGSVAPNVLPLELSEKCNFGLVWDGSSAVGIEGGYGEYLRFNNSHKCGCYLASGIPVFVWKESGMAHFVKETGCGYVIESLKDIAGILKSVSMDDYVKMIECTKSVAMNIREGKYLSDALKQAINE